MKILITTIDDMNKLIRIYYTFIDCIKLVLCNYCQMRPYCVMR